MSRPRNAYISPHCHVGLLFFLLHLASADSSAAATSSTTQHHQHIIYTTPSTQHHQHDTIYTTSSTVTLSTLHHHKQHHQHNIYTTSSTLHHVHYIIKNNIINTTSPTHHLHNIINTTPSTLHHQNQHHQHNIINTTPSRQHHQHNTINTTSVSFCVAGAALGASQCHFAWQVRHSDTAHGAKNFLHTLTIYSLRKSFSSFSTILPLLPHSSWYPFCFSSLWIVLCSVSLAYSTGGCPKTLLTCGVIRSFNFFLPSWDINTHNVIYVIPHEFPL